MDDIIFNWNGAEYIAKVAAAKDIGVEKAALVVQKDAMDDAPVDTGALRNSITYNLLGDGKAEIGSNLEYATKMEFGGSSQAPRGYLRPAIDKNYQNTLDLISEEIKRVIK